MARYPCLALLLFIFVGCEDSRDPVDGSRPGIDSGSPGSDGGGTDGSRPGPDGASGDDGGVSDGGGSGSSTPICVLGCTSTSDCVTPSPAFDLDNYRCEDGWCHYTGCVDDDECRTTFGNPDYVCRDPGTGQRSCLEACASAADCGSGTAAFDGDNYRCDSGLCLYEGCNTDAECESTFGAAFGCFDIEPPSTPLPIPTADANCVRRCLSPADCTTDSGAYDFDNYSCESGACRYQGCNDDGECQTSLSSSSYVCR